MKLDAQDRKPKIKERIDRVGVEGLRTHLKIVRQNVEFSHLPSIDVMIDLPSDKKGIHMSRLIESINETVSQKTEGIKESLEEFGNEILKEILKRHPYKRGEITIRTTLILNKITPVSGRTTNEPYDVIIKVMRDNGRPLKYLEIKAIGNTLCPHSLEITGGKSHIQRAELQLGLLTDLETDVTLEKMIEICEGCFSSPTFTVLKSEDEKFIVEKMFSNPKFVEDLTRECFDEVINLSIKGKVKIRAVSYESIHKHNAVSEIEREINGGLDV